MKTVRIKGITELIKLVDKQVDCISKYNKDELLLFRGQNVDEPLLPRNARKHVAYRKYNIKEIHRLHDIETIMLDEFKRRAQPLLEQQVVPKSDWDWLTLAQHHGMDTRLLDWTENPLVALYFALENDNRTSSIVWLLKIEKTEIITPTSGINPFWLPHTRIFKPSIVSKRLSAQSGWFSIHKYLKEKDSFIPLERNDRFKHYLTKIQITGDLSKMKRNLNLYGINSATLFPDLDGLCKYINLKRELDNIYNIRMPEEIKKRPSIKE